MSSATKGFGCRGFGTSNGVLHVGQGTRCPINAGLFKASLVPQCGHATDEMDSVVTLVAVTCAGWGRGTTIRTCHLGQLSVFPASSSLAERRWPHEQTSAIGMAFTQDPYM